MDNYKADKIVNAINGVGLLIFVAIVLHSCTQHNSAYQSRIADALDRAYPPPAQQKEIAK